MKIISKASYILSVLLTALVIAGCQPKKTTSVDPATLEEQARLNKAKDFIRTITDKVIDSSNTPIQLTFEEVAVLDKILSSKEVTGARRFTDATKMDVSVLVAQARFNEIVQPEKLIFARYSWDGKYVCYICLDYDNTLIDDGYGKSDMHIPWYLN